jgi:hypothetical protein
MYTHGPNCLKGPVSRTSPWWSVSLANPSIRFELVERVRREIAAGTYETPEKWEAALERFLRRMEQP